MTDISINLSLSKWSERSFLLLLLLHIPQGVSTGGASGVGVSGSLLTSHQDLAEEGVGPGSDIGDLITDAMEDFSPTESVAVKVGRTKREKVLRVSHMHKMEMRVTGESMLIDFDSDSDNDAVAATRSGVKKHGFLGSPLPGPSPASGDAGRGRVRGETARKGVESGHGSIFSDSDDDFCIVHTPTSTKVVSVVPNFYYYPPPPPPVFL